MLFEWFEWYGYNDFYKVVINLIMVWLYGVLMVNIFFLGIGECMGNILLEVMVMEYI